MRSLPPPDPFQFVVEMCVLDRTKLEAMVHHTEELFGMPRGVCACVYVYMGVGKHTRRAGSL